MMMDRGTETETKKQTNKQRRAQTDRHRERHADRVDGKTNQNNVEREKKAAPK